MKPHRIIKSFKGSQTGHDHDHFEAGTIRDLSPDLARIVVREGWAKEHIESLPASADQRDTKVVEPEEFKDAEDDEADDTSSSGPARRKKKA